MAGSTAKPEIAALSIARPLWEALSAVPFEGWGWGVFRRACNLIDASRRVIALVAPEIGRGPFSIVLDTPDFFETLTQNQPVRINQHGLTTGNWQISLKQAEIWNPTLPHCQRPLKLTPSTIALLKSYAGWPHLRQASPTEKIILRSVQKMTSELNEAIVQNQPVEAAVARLAGLGVGLTPTGDDYLVGVMVALWLAGRQDSAVQINQIAAPRTTALSAAFLSAAARGEFVETWHELSHALFAESSLKVADAARRITQFGASSGYEALAGFATTILSLEVCKRLEIGGLEIVNREPPISNL